MAHSIFGPWSPPDFVSQLPTLSPGTHTAAIIKPSAPQHLMLVKPLGLCTLDSLDLSVLCFPDWQIPPKDQQKIPFPREAFDFGSEKQSLRQGFSLKQLTGRSPEHRWM